MELDGYAPTTLQWLGNGLAVVFGLFLFLLLLIGAPSPVVRLVGTAWGGFTAGAIGLWTVRRVPVLLDTAVDLTDGGDRREAGGSYPALAVETVGVVVYLVAAFAILMALITTWYFTEAGRAGDPSVSDAGNPVVPVVGLRLDATWGIGALLLVCSGLVLLVGYGIDRVSGSG